MEGTLSASKSTLRSGLSPCLHGSLASMFMSHYFVFKGISRRCFDNLPVTFYCTAEMNTSLTEDGKYAVLGCHLLYKKEMHVCQSRDKSQAAKKKKCPAEQKISQWSGNNGHCNGNLSSLN